MKLVAVTLEVSQLPISWLNSFLSRNNHENELILLVHTFVISLSSFILLLSSSSLTTSYSVSFIIPISPDIAQSLALIVISFSSRYMGFFITPFSSTSAPSLVLFS